MGNGYNHHQQLHQRSTFLPMLCSRPSIKDVHLPNWQQQDRSAASSSSSSSTDPSSPRVSCIGQVKRNNRVIGFPPPYRFTTTTTSATATATANIKYHKLRRLFSGKNLTNAAVAGTTTASMRKMIVESARGPNKSSDDNDNDNYYAPAVVNIAALDPPLPVVKRVQQPAADSRDEVNLWKRRSGGVALKGLQLQQIHIPNNHYLQPTTV